MLKVDACEYVFLVRPI